MRQNSAVHERVLAELLADAGVCADYRALSEAERVALLTAELASDRPLAAPWHAWSEATAGELAIVHAAADIRRRLGPEERKSTRLNSSHYCASRMPSSA